nr:ABC transporter permease [Streptomyces fildesensis]
MSATDVGVRVGSGGSVTGTGVLTRLALRRDRIMIPVWVYALTAAVLSTCLSLGTLYGTLKERTDFARSMNVNSSLRALYGPAFSGESIGALTAWRMGCIGAALTGLMSILVVVRHTREEEESGRQELLSSGVVGRRAPLTAGLLTALTASAALALIVATALSVLGQSVAGSAALGLALAGSGLMFAGVAAVTAQLTASARVAKGLAGARVPAPRRRRRGGGRRVTPRVGLAARLDREPPAVRRGPVVGARARRRLHRGDDRGRLRPGGET